MEGQSSDSSQAHMRHGEANNGTAYDSVEGGAEKSRMPDISAAAQHIFEFQTNFIGQVASIWSSSLNALNRAQEAPNDRRFAHEAWHKDPHFDLIRRTYLAYSGFLMNAVDWAQLDAKTSRQLRFTVRQFVDAMSPTNFFATNPEAIQSAIESGGRSVGDGMALLYRDWIRGRISTNDDRAFEVGKNLAVTEGSVVYENQLIQLIQYAPKSNEVHKRPLVIIPPCINKYYILDLQTDNSFVRYAVEQGHTVFIVSWRNIAPELGHLTWDNYLTLGVMRAIETALEITGADKVNALGFCIGGTLLCSALAVMKTNKVDKVESITLLTTMLDFTDAGEIGSLLTDQTMIAQEMTVSKGGVVQGRELGLLFSALRANDLVWSYVVSNYLKGKPPAAFDLLFWNADSTSLPGPMYCWYVRNTYLENRLSTPGKAVVCGVPLDLGKIDCPAYLYASQEDHIVPWRTAYTGTKLLSGSTTFVLGASGHIAGVINPVSKNRRNYWTNSTVVPDADSWLTEAEYVAGSWWRHWSAWLAQHGGELVPARRTPGNKQYPVIEPAPGRYVKEVL